MSHVAATSSLEAMGVTLPDAEPAAIPSEHSATYLLLRAPQAAALLNTSERTWRTWNATGKIPRPMHIGRGVYWRPEELKAWIAAGCPDRVTWEVIQKL
jgi:predicted DNA-binding transcriptional regulator AlpA